MRKRYGSLTWKLFVICFAFVLSSVSIVTGLSYRYISHEIRSNNQYYLEEILSKVNDYFNLSFSSLQTILFAVSSTADMISTSQEAAAHQLENVYSMNSDYVSDVYLIRSDLSIVGGTALSAVFDDPRPEREPIYRQALESRPATIVTAPYKSFFAPKTVTMARVVGHSDTVVALDMDLSWIEQQLLKINSQAKANLLVLDEQGRLIAGSVPPGASVDPDFTFRIGGESSEQIAASGQTIQYLKSDSGKPLTLMRKTVDKFPWAIVATSDGSSLLQSLHRIRAYFFCLLLAGLLFSLATSAVITRFIRKPLYTLIRKMNLVKQGQLDVALTMKRSDEFGELADTFVLMIHQIKDLIDQMKLNKDLQRRLEIQVLHAQINPHFLYNTLGAVSNVSRLGEHEKVDTVIRSLISLLEYGVRDAGEAVTLSEEVANIEHYLNIQRIRYNREFPLLLQIAGELQNFPVFRMLLQPMVENCVFHGYSGGRIPGPITITASSSSRLVKIAVKDEGAGMSEEVRCHVLEPGYTVEEQRRKRIGLRNIHERMRLYYGMEYGLEIAGRPGEGTVVTAVFPKERAE